MRAIKPTVFKEGREQRDGKGFSRGELKKTGLNIKEASKLGIPVDSRRRTIHKENIDAIKRFLESRKAVSKSKRRRKSKS